MAHNQDWIRFLPEIYFKTAEAKKNWKITKEQFAADLMHRGPKSLGLVASALYDKYIHESS